MIVTSVSTEVKCHDWQTGNLINTYKPQTSQKSDIRSLSWAKEGKWMVIVPDNSHAEVISLNNPAIKHLFSIKEVQNVTCASFQNNTKRNIFLGTSAGQTLLYDIKTKSVKKTFPMAKAALLKVQCCLKDSHVLSGCETGEVYIHNAVSGVQSSILKVPKSTTLTAFECHPTARNLVAGSSGEGIVTMWDINISKSVVHNHLHLAPITDISVSSYQPELLITLGRDRRVCIYDYRLNKIVIDATLSNTPTAVDFGTDGIHAEIGFQNGQLVNYDIRVLKETSTKFEGHTSKINCVLFQKNCDYKTKDIHITEATIEAELSEFESTEKSDFFTQPCSVEAEKEPTLNVPAVDSFLEAIGVNSPDSGLMGSSVAARSIVPSPNALNSLNNNANISPALQNFVRKNSSVYKTNVDKLRTFSTPNNAVVESPHFSPICHTATTLTEQEVRRVVREELDLFRVELDQFKKEMKDELYTVRDRMENYFLHVHLTLIKEFINIEDLVNKLREDVLKPVNLEDVL